VLGNQGKDACVKDWGPTAEYLNRRLAPERFEIVPLDFGEILAAARTEHFDYVIANPSYYAHLEHLGLAYRLATLQVPGLSAPEALLGGVIFTQAARTDILTLEDLRSKRFAAVHPESLGGWQAAFLEIKNAGLDPFRHFESLTFPGTQTGVVHAVLSGLVDAGTVRSTHLERMAAEGHLQLNQIKILHSTASSHPDYPYFISTRLYPEWPIAAFHGNDPTLDKHVAVMLMEMPHDDPAAIAMKAAGWSTPQDYSSVHKLLYALNLPPYDREEHIPFTNMLRQYWPALLGLCLLAAASSVVAVRFSRINARMATIDAALRVRTEELTATLRSIGDGVITTDMGGRILSLNPAAEALTGWKKVSALGRSVDEVLRYINPATQEYIKHADQVAATEAEQQTHSERAVLVTARGTEHHIASSHSRIRDARGEYAGSVFVFRDISEEHARQQRVSDSEERHRVLFTDSPDALFIIEEGRVVDCNHAAGALFRTGRTEILGASVADLSPAVQPNGGASQEAASRMLEAARKHGKHTFEWLHLRIDGEQLWVEVSAQPLFLEGRNVFFCSVRDITGRKLAEERLRHSEARFQQLAEQSDIIVWEVDADGCYTHVSHVVEKVLGYTPEELIGRRHFYDIHPEEGRDAFIALSKAVFERKESFKNFENPAVARDGRTIWLSTTGLPLLNPDGSLAGYRGSDTDITARKQAELALKAREEELDRYFTSSLDLLCIADQEGRFLRLNPEWETTLGYSLAELEGQSYLDFVHPEDVQRTIDVGSILESQKEVLSFENRLRHKDGHYRWIEWRSRPAGNIIYAAARDITARKETEEALVKERQRLSYIIEGTNIGTWEWNIQTGETVFNDRWAEIIGHTLDELSPCNIETWKQFAHPEDLALSEEILTRHFTGDLDYYECETRVRHKNGHWEWVLDRGRVSSWTEDGQPLLMQGTHQVITERKHAEMEREQLQAQLSQAQKMESIGRLAGGVAHDFNNMLGVILGHTELALQQIAPALPLYNDLQEVQKAAERSAALTRQLLAFARKQTVLPRHLNLNGTVENMLSMLHRLIGEDIDLTWLPGDNAGAVLMDPSQLDQILANLCVNARDAITGNGKIEIVTRQVQLTDARFEGHEGTVSGDFVQLAIRDNGCGIPADTISKLFEPFFTTKELGKGTGLGLATVYGIVRQNHGYIQVKSVVGQGTIFEILLPRQDVHPDAIVKPSAVEPPAVSVGTILLVEDEPSLLLLTHAALQRKGYTVLAASTPKEAIELAKDHPGPIRLLLTDVIMPELNGFELAKRLLTLYPTLQCLFMSGYSASVIENHGILDTGVHFLQKPFGMKDLTAKIHEILEPALTPHQA
jgi:PAS domain S-box-containing protein